MLQRYSPQSEAIYEGGSQSLGLAHYLEMVKRRALYSALAFGVVLLFGVFITAIQRPIYEAKGKILVKSQEIPVDLVRPTVTEAANQRIQVIQQRILTRDNLLPLVNKYGLFARERQWMSGTELLDLMRESTTFELVDTSATQGRQSTIAFTVSFRSENPETTMKVTNDLLTLILSEDARNRTSRATETTNFLSRKSQRLQGELVAIEAQIAENRARPHEDPSQTTDPAKIQAADLMKLKEELAQKSSIYSAEHPAVKSLKKKVAAMERLVSETPPAAVTQENNVLMELARQAAATGKNLEDTNKKLEEARLGEKLERDQRSERLQVIEQPILPQKPIKPNKIKFLAMAFALAAGAGAGVIFAAESLDRSIRYSHQLVGVADGRSIVSIPYIATRAERRRGKGRQVLLAAGVAGLLLAGLVGYLLFGPPIDLSWVNASWLDRLAHLSK